MSKQTCYHCFSEIGNSAGACPHCGFDPASEVGKYPLALSAGSILNGRYILGRVLGQGGFGITYVAQDVQTGQRVAIKEYFPETMVTRTDGHNVTAFSGPRTANYAYGRQCFLTEAQTLAQFIGARNIVRVHSYFEENGTAYFVMDYVDGMSLKDYLKQQPDKKISWEEALNLLLPIMDALSLVHSKGIIHRDIAPDNIHIAKDGTVQLLDFGAARYSLGDRSRSLDVVLKAGYAPKEQYTRHGRQGPYTDVYSLAATFYFAITGRTPPESVDRTDSEEDELILPSSLRVRIPVEAEDALEKALAVRYQDRFQTMAEFRDALMGSDAEQQRLEAERLEQERLERERLEWERQERERLERERIEQERLEQERLEWERQERERIEQERLARERLEQERIEQERLARERLEQEHLEQEHLERERIAQAQLQQEEQKETGHQEQHGQVAVAQEEQKRKPLPVKFLAMGAAAVAVLVLACFLLLGRGNSQPAAPTEDFSVVMPGIQVQSLAAGSQFTVGLQQDGTVTTAGYNGYGQCDVDAWQNVASVCAGWQHTLGLKTNGRLLAAGDNQYGQCDVYDWENVLAIAAGGGHSVGLTADGTVLATGDDRYGQCQVSGWTEVSAIAAGGWHTVALTESGTVLATGLTGVQADFQVDYGQCEVGSWKNLTALSAGLYHTVGLKADGTVVAVGDNRYGQCEVSDWTDIVAIAAGWHHTVGLKSDGTLVTTGVAGEVVDAGQCDVSGWTDVIAISAGGYHTTGLKTDGTAVSTQPTSQLWNQNQGSVSGWQPLKTENTAQ